MIKKFMCAALIGTFILASTACGKQSETENIKQTETQNLVTETEGLSEVFDFST